MMSATVKPITRLRIEYPKVVLAGTREKLL